MQLNRPVRRRSHRSYVRCAEAVKQEQRSQGQQVALLEALEGRRLLSFGGLDKSFGLGGSASADFSLGDRAGAAVGLPNGKIVVAGFADNGKLYLAGFNADGSPDDGSNNDVNPNDEFGAEGTREIDLALKPYGPVLSPSTYAASHVTGIAYASGRIAMSLSIGDGLAPSGPSDGLAVMVVNADGSDATGFDGDGFTVVPLADAYATAVTFDSKGRIVLAGNANPAVLSRFAAARLLPDGSRDTDFGSDGVVVLGQVLGNSPGNDFATSVAVQDTGTGKGILIGGGTESGSAVVVRLAGSEMRVGNGVISAGALDPTFGGGDGIAATSGEQLLRITGLALDDWNEIVASTMDPSFSDSSFTALRFSQSGGAPVVMSTPAGAGFLSAQLNDIVVLTDGAVVGVGVAAVYDPILDLASFHYAAVEFNSTNEVFIFPAGPSDFAGAFGHEDGAVSAIVQANRVVLAGTNFVGATEDDFFLTAVKLGEGASVSFETDPENAAQTALVVVGTSGDEIIQFVAGATPGRVEVLVNGASRGIFVPTGRIVVEGGNGNDIIQVAGGIRLRAEINGGSGDDSLKGGNENDIIIGGPGNDLLGGTGGRDLLIGGGGADRIIGQSEDDILIAASTAHDADPVKLRAILTQWSGTLPFAERVANLSGSGDLLHSDYIMLSDGAVDILTGAAGTDWFLFSSNTDTDHVTDLGSFESCYSFDVQFLAQLP